MKLQPVLVKMTILLAMLMLASACSNSLWIVKPITPDITLNGKKIENSGLVLRDNVLYVPSSFVTNILGASLEKPTKQHFEDSPVDVADGIYYSNKVAVLMYHAIMEEASQANIISAEQFREQLQWLSDEGFAPISIEQYVSFIHEEGAVPDNAVLITFDDGYENFYTYAYPVLVEFNYPAVNFVIVETIDNHSTPGLKKLSWDQMREMKENRIAFHNHTYNSHSLVINANGIEQPILISNLYLSDENREETEAEYTARVVADLSKAEQRLHEELGNTIQVVAFPYGAYNKRLLSIMESIGIETSFTIKNGINSSGNTVGFRINAGHSNKTTEEMLALLKQQPVINDKNVMLLNENVISFSQIIKARGKYPALYPLRELSNELNIYVSWDAANKTVTIEQ